MTERRPQVARTSSGRFRSVSSGTKSASARSKSNGKAGRASVKTAAVRGTSSRVRVVRRPRSQPAAPSRAASTSSPARKASRSVSRSRPSRPATSTRKPRASSARAKTARARPRTQAQRRSAAAPRSSHSTRQSSSRGRERPVSYAVKLLKQDHSALLDGAVHFEEAPQEEKHQIAERFCKLLSLHAQIEEELLYPQAHEALGHDSQRIAIAQVEHAVIRDLVSQIEDMDEVDELFTAKMQVLTSLLSAHILEEENDIFPRLERTSLDLHTLGEQLAWRKQELSGDEELVIAYEYEEDEPLSRAPRGRHAHARSRNSLIHPGGR